MYDGQPQPGRNDECWCGSGRKYKKCHHDFDERLQALYEAGEEVPLRSLLKTAADIEGVRRSAAVNVGALDYVAERIGPGVTTADIDRWVHDYTVEHGAIPAPLDYEGFPKSVCTSVDEVVCHGIPREDEVPPEKADLVRVTKEAAEEGLRAVKPWGHLGDIGAAVNAYAQAHGYSVVREFGGHGIGLEFHEDPFVSFVTEAGTGPVLAPGLMFTIEPMINLGKPDIDMSDPNGWTVRTADGLPTAQWEVQIVVTEDGYELLSW